MTIHTIQVTVNGELEVVDLPAHWTLLQMLREKIGLTGVKNGCSGGECGACTVMLNGEPVNSCMVLGVECDGKDLKQIANPEYAGRMQAYMKSEMPYHGIKSAGERGQVTQ